MQSILPTTFTIPYILLILLFAPQVGPPQITDLSFIFFFLYYPLGLCPSSYLLCCLRYLWQPLLILHFPTSIFLRFLYNLAPLSFFLLAEFERVTSPITDHLHGGGGGLSNFLVGSNSSLLCLNKLLKTFFKFLLTKLFFFYTIILKLC